jgi:hypothetical protein
MSGRLDVLTGLFQPCDSRILLSCPREALFEDTSHFLRLLSSFGAWKALFFGVSWPGRVFQSLKRESSGESASWEQEWVQLNRHTYVPGSQSLCTSATSLIISEGPSFFLTLTFHSALVQFRVAETELYLFISSSPYQTRGPGPDQETIKVKSWLWRSKQILFTKHIQSIFLSKCFVK